MALLMIARLITRRSFGSFIPWWVVFAGELFNEVMDRLNFGSWRWEDTSLDIVNTLLWPTVICLGVRLRPMIRSRTTIERDFAERDMGQRVAAEGRPVGATDTNI